MSASDNNKMGEILKTMTQKLEGETTSYGALQYLQSFVARKKRSLDPQNLSACVFHGCSYLIGRGDAADAGNALVWYVFLCAIFHS
jgi:hypothetical protein